MFEDDAVDEGVLDVDELGAAAAEADELDVEEPESDDDVEPESLAVDDDEEPPRLSVL